MDIDGTLTDGAMYYGENGESLKRFHVRDGMGVVLLHRAGINTAIITSETSKIVESRAIKLGITDVILGCRNKTKALDELSQNLNLRLDEIAYIGDDVNDYYVMQMVGFSACPSDAVESIKGISDYLCKFSGGNGAMREFAEIILIAQDKEIKLIENW